jgi:hypothetical protein
MQELENEITDMLAHLPRERTYASIAFHGPLPDFVRSIRDDLQDEPIGRYRWQTVYEIMPRGNMEKESKLGPTSAIRLRARRLIDAFGYGILCRQSLNAAKPKND